ncbi:MAG: hypothetical protein ACM31H_00425 [Nitrososphaerales archaeon]
MSKEHLDQVLQLKRPISATLTLGDISMIEEYEEETGKTNRSDAMRDLLKIGWMVWKNIHKIKDPNLAVELKSQIEEGAIVDFVRKMNHREFDILTSIIKVESKERGIKI